MKKQAYLASPLGFNEASKHYYEQVILPSLQQEVGVLDPWNLVSHEEFAQAIANDTVQDLVEKIGTRNIELLRNADLLIAFLDGQEIDSGTASEIGYAAANGLLCLAVRSDLRQSGEAGALVNLQVETFIKQSGGEIFTSLNSLLEKLPFYCR